MTSRQRRSYVLPETRLLMKTVKEILFFRNQTQIDLAHEMRANPPWLSTLLSGAQPDPQMSSVVRILKGLGVRARIVIDDDETGKTWNVSISGWE